MTGYILISDKEQGDTSDQKAALKLSPTNDTFRLVLGILAVITGLFKLLSVVPGDVPVVGDLIPALCGFFTGSIFLFEYYWKTVTVDSDTHILVDLILIRNKKRIGFMAIGAAILHFLFPQALLI